MNWLRNKLVSRPRLGLLLLTASMVVLAGCARNVAPPLPYDPENVEQLREEIGNYR